MIWNAALWNWTSVVWVIALALAVVYVVTMRGATRIQWASFTVGLMLLVLAFVSPIGVLADGYLFTAHMIQHLLLLLVIPLCLLCSLPGERLAAWFEGPWLNRIGRMLAIPVIGWICGVGAMWFWHVPTFCNAAAQDTTLGGVRDLSFVFAGMIFWWPIYSPVKHYRLSELNGIAYLFSACLGCTLLGIYITFTTISVCPAFANPVDRIGILNLLYDTGLTPGMDQHLGGLMMWVPPCTLYVGAIISLLCRWYAVTQPMASTSSSQESVLAHES